MEPPPRTRQPRRRASRHRFTMRSDRINSMSPRPSLGMIRTADRDHVSCQVLVAGSLPTSTRRALRVPLAAGFVAHCPHEPSRRTPPVPPAPGRSGLPRPALAPAARRSGPGAARASSSCQRGLSRHEVVFVGYEKRGLRPQGTAGRDRRARVRPAARARGARPAGGDPGRARASRAPTGATRRPACSITRFLEASVPYRTLFMQQGLERYRERLLDAMAGLLVRLHLAGFVWGDCSLSNTLFRRDAGELAGVPGRRRDRPSCTRRSRTGARAYDLDVMEENVAGELADLRPLVALPPALSTDETGAQIRARYTQLWDEITREVLLKPDERFRIHERIRALNEPGFHGRRARAAARARRRAPAPAHDRHRSRLPSPPAAQHDGCRCREPPGRAVPRRDPRDPGDAGAREEPQRAHERGRVFMAQGALRAHGRADRSGARAGADAAELYAEVLEHKWFRSEQAQHDVGLETAIEDYLARFRPADGPAG